MFEKILLALDTPHASNPAYQYGVSLAESYGARLMLLHALFPGEGNAPVPPSEEVFFVPATLPDSPAVKQYRQVWEQYLADNDQALAALGQDAIARGLSVEWSQNYGLPGKTICALAKNWEADLIVVGRRHQSRLSEWFMGSVSNYVLHHAPCSVLIAQVEPEPEPEA